MGVYASKKVLEINIDGTIEKIEVRKRFPVGLVQEFGKLTTDDLMTAVLFSIEHGITAFLTEIKVDGEVVTKDNAVELLSLEPKIWRPVYDSCVKAMNESSLVLGGYPDNGDGKGAGSKKDRRKSATDNVPLAKSAGKQKVS